MHACIHRASFLFYHFHRVLGPEGVTILWAKALGSAIIHGFALLIGVTLLLPPATMLRAIVQEEAGTGEMPRNVVKHGESKSCLV
jgi:hypothetical protein